MKPRLPAVLLVALSGLLFAGCVSTGQERKADDKKAAAANVELGVRYMQRGQLQAAKDKLERAEKQDPGNFKVHWAMAQLMEQINQPGEAERYYQAAMRLSPGNSEIANIYAVFLCKSGKVDKALPLFDGVIRDRLYPSPWVAATNAAICLRADKRNADAVTWLERALAMQKDYVDAVVEMADLQLVLGKAVLSRQIIDQYLANPRRSPADRARVPQLLLVGVRAALSQGDRPAADNYARLLRRDFANSPETQFLPQLLQGAT